MLLLCALVGTTVNAWAATTWTRVTDIATLLGGGTFILGYEATANSGVIVPLRTDACAATTSANGILYSGTGTGTTSNSETITMSSVTETAKYEIYITASSTVTNAINMQMGSNSGNYFGCPNSKNTAKLYSSASANTAYTLSIGDNNYVTLECKAADTGSKYKYLKYNASSPRFANYSTTPEKLVFYKKNSSSKQQAELSFDVPSYKVAPGTLLTSTVKNPNGLTVSYASDDEDIAYVDETTGEVLTGNKFGTATITASSAADDTYDAGSATYTITVYDPNANDGSELKPYTVTEAIALINTLGTASSSPVYVKGIVSTGLSSLNTTNGYANYYISVDGTTTAQLECYRGYNLGKTKFTTTSDLSLGDEVVVYGSLKMYNTTPEFNQNNFISQLKHGSEPEVRSIEVKAANKYKSYVSSQNLVVPAGVTAYIATGETATELTLTSVPKIKAGTPVILYANATEDTGFSFQITDDEVTYPATNLLKISDGTVVNGAYVLAKKNDVVGFYKWAGGALSPGKVYVEPSSAAREFIGFNFDEVTGINEVKNEKETVNGIFDLQGRKVVTPSKGLYIVNGKKVVIK